jgi:hypothetical protein
MRTIWPSRTANREDDEDLTLQRWPLGLTKTGTRESDHDAVASADDLHSINADVLGSTGSGQRAP